MESSLDQHGFELIYIIVNFGMGSRIVKAAKREGITGATIFLGRGTVKNQILEFLELYDVRKEVVMMAAEKKLAEHTLEVLAQEFKFAKPNHGIAFTTSLTRIVGSKNFNLNNAEESRGVDKKMYQAIFTIVDKGKAHEVVDVVPIPVPKEPPSSMRGVPASMRRTSCSLWRLNRKRRLC